MDTKGWRKKEMFGLQKNKGYKMISEELMNALDDYFGDRLDCFVVSNQMDTPHTEFRIEFEMYKFFNVVLEYDRGCFGCSIQSGEVLIGLENSQEWYDTADMKKFLKELEFQLELRIPDKFLKYHGWK